MSETKTRVAILISGSGTNLQAFIDRAIDGRVDLDIVVVFSNRVDAYGLERARKAHIPWVSITHADYPDRESFDRSVAAVLDEYAPDLLILAGFMRILSPWFVRHYEGRVLNIHPALLPKYPGLNTHARALEAGDSHHGSTVHFVTEELDGGPRILAGRIAIEEGDTSDSLNSRVQAVEHEIYPQAAQWFAEGRLEFRDAAAWLDGKRLDEPVTEDF
ncbi:MAG: phosphoribosylglycinamide formyltransferase [Woeseiaceae bacterium]|nr:phosphoribosylglycinamide formyltransferase [Woeseiaceae bacterium]